MIHAIAAGSAPRIVDSMNAFAAADGILVADFGAFAAIRAKSLNEPDLRFGGQAFGIGAPPAGERASLEKNHRPDPRPVMDGKTLDVRNNRALL
jgi:hypothetical protein